MRRKKRLLLLIVALPLVVVVAVYISSRIRGFASPVSVHRLPGSTAAFSGRVRIATYNIAHARGGQLGASNSDGGTKEQRVRRLEEIGRLLDHAGAEIVCLNEVDFRASWSYEIDQASIIAHAGNYPFMAKQVNFDLAIPFFGLRFGNVILSRYPIESAWIERLPSNSSLRRLFAGAHDSLMARVTLDEDHPVLVWAVHLESRSRVARRDGAQLICERLSGRHEPTFVIGDFNSSPGGFPFFEHSSPSAFDLLLGCGQVAAFPSVSALQQVHTFPSEQADRSIDWLLSPADLHPTDGVVIQAGFSDHLPVVATYVFGTPPN